jgi:hypothetical protein
MKLTPDEYRRGLVKWNPAASIKVQTATSDDPLAPLEWSAPLSDPNGSQVLSPPGQYVQMSWQQKAAGPAPYPVRWDRSAPEGAVQSLIYDPLPHKDTFIKLAHIPNYGVYHRLVIEAPPTLTWENDSAIRVGDAVVRLITGIIRGERVPPFEQVEIEDEKVSILTDWAGTVQEDGRFIEIVAPGSDEGSAELTATAIMGLLALVFGSGAIGKVLFSEPWLAAPGEPQKGQYRVPITYKNLRR